MHNGSFFQIVIKWNLLYVLLYYIISLLLHYTSAKSEKVMV